MMKKKIDSTMLRETPGTVQRRDNCKYMFVVFSDLTEITIYFSTMNHQAQSLFVSSNEKRDIREGKVVWKSLRLVGAFYRM